MASEKSYMIIDAIFYRKLPLNVLLLESFSSYALHLSYIFTITVLGWEVYESNVDGKTKFI